MPYTFAATKRGRLSFLAPVSIIELLLQYGKFGLKLLNPTFELTTMAATSCG